MWILIFILILSILVFVHELGHFLVAKRNGITVEEFGMGLPPRAWGIKKGGTLYSLNWLPIGGFVRLRGEDQTDAEALTDPGSFASKSPWVRTKVLLAGVIANAVLGVIILTLVFRLGVPEYVPHPIVTDLIPGSPAEEVGILVDDRIIAINDTELDGSEHLISLLSQQGVDDSVDVTVLRVDEEITLTATPRDGKLGVQVSDFDTVQYPLSQASIKGVEAAYRMTGLMIQGLRDFFVQLIVQQEVADDVAGPIGIAQMTGQAQELGFSFVLQFMGILSLNLALINILPFPALDGGRLLFVIIEVVTRRRVNQNLERWVHLVGMVLLLLLLLVITIQDVQRFFQ